MVKQTLLPGLLALLAVVTPAHAGGPSNIVLFISDDHGLLDCGPYGNKVVKTPHLDQLAKHSLKCTRAYAPAATCVPSRSAIYTGLFPFRNGAHSNRISDKVKPGTQSLPHFLQPLGYRVALAGKTHIGPAAAFPFEYVAKSNVQEPGTKGGLHLDVDLKAVAAWLHTVKKGQPFCLVVGCHSPHVVWPQQSSYDPAKLDLPAKHIDTPETKKARARYYEDVTKMDAQLGALIALLQQQGLWDDTLFIYTTDNGPQWPFAKWTLYEAGIHVPLLVRWPGHTKGGASTDALISLIDLTPTFVEAAGGKSPQGLDAQSLVPLLKGKTGKHRDEIYATHTGDGPFNRSPARCVIGDRYKYILNLAPDVKFTTHIDVARDHDGGREYWPSWLAKAKSDGEAAALVEKYHHRPSEELFDLVADPHEMKNLAKDPKYAGELTKLRAQLAAWRKQQGDEETGPEVLPPGMQQPPLGAGLLTPPCSARVSDPAALRHTDL